MINNRFVVNVYKDGIIICSMAREYSKQLPKEIQEMLL